MFQFDFTILPQEVQQILAILRRKRLDFWLVGGFVRDWVGGCPNHRDIDIGVSANVFKLRNILRGKLIRGNHPLVKVGSCEILPIPDIDADLQRRDFSVNAMAIDSSGNLLDPLGGAADASGHIFRMIRPDIFLEDPVRVARLCRLSARLGWSIEPQTAAAAKYAAQTVNPQPFRKENSLRMGLEIIKSFDDAQPSRFLKLAHEFHALPLLMPCLVECFKVGEENHLKRILARCDRAPVGQYGVRMAALLMDLAPYGKERRSRRSAGIAKNFLYQIHWDYVVKEIFPRRCLWDTATIASAIRLRGLDFTEMVDWQALSRCTVPNLTVDCLYAIKEAAFGEKMDSEKWFRIRSNILKKAMRRSGSKREKLMALRFYGYSKKLANRILRGEVIPSF